MDRALVHLPPAPPNPARIALASAAASEILEPAKNAVAEDLFYRYNAIDKAKGAIRLLILKGGSGNDIKCELVHTTIDRNIIPYEAVSYTWGPEFAAESINVCGRRLPVTFHLSRILRDLRHADEDRVLWVDAVCINQQDATEKGLQVAQMKDIFRSAKCVLLCICRSTDYTDLLMDSLAKLESNLCDTQSYDSQDLNTSWRDVQKAIASQHVEPLSRHSEASLERQLKALASLQRQGLEYILNSPWFLRVWILQEVANGSSASVYCGRKYVSAATFAVSPRLLNAEIPLGQDGIVAEVLSIMPGPLRRDPFQELYPLLQRFRGSHATVECDRIFALFGICQDVHIDTRLLPDYQKSEKDVIRDTISYICRVEVANSPFDSISDFLEKLDHLDNLVLSELLFSTDHINASSLLRHRKGFVTATQELLDLASTNTMIGEGVMALLLQQHNADTVLSGWEAWDSLRFAAKNGHDALAEFMVERITDIDSLNDSLSVMKTRLFLAAENGETTLVNLLLAKGANIEGNGHYEGWNHRCASPITGAARFGHTTVVQILIDNGADTNSVGLNGVTPLLNATTGGHEDIVSLLLNKGVNLLATGHIGKHTPLQIAAKTGQEAIVRLLLAHGAPADGRSDNTLSRSNEAPLMIAARYCRPSILRMLFEAGAYATQSDLYDMMDAAANYFRRSDFSSLGCDRIKRHDQEVVVQILLEKGAKPNYTLIHRLSSTPGTIAQLLVKHIAINGESPYTIECHGRVQQRCSTTTPLIYATRAGSTHMVKLLIENGANLETGNSEGRTPLSLAAGKGDRDIVEILLDAGADAEAVDDNGQTPLSRARSTSVYGFLVERCARRKGHMLVDQKVCSGHKA
ncbi:hypothetical protein PFICI_01591 [Pestalotiopsis fici W106-1]|uniref:Heterokaryon incompatibility domain-containing protein n=1 Tax=Pestalotiopsis fici (strain W106-1 / CGMCC3.15140) TaxID=1229662 RepID=W3XNZ3_PESFW|nr:uncharacterized protein PFICI_01591 [Pestalotiopsis fici W106-1]ETS87763.1 hypothetical protein PFICI_01591 [Pestalotiopsis fici W106-1]